MKKLNEMMAKSDQLMYQMIPKAVAERLKAGEEPMSTCEASYANIEEIMFRRERMKIERSDRRSRNGKKERKSKRMRSRGMKRRDTELRIGKKKKNKKKNKNKKKK